MLLTGCVCPLRRVQVRGFDLLAPGNTSASLIKGLGMFPQQPGADLLHELQVSHEAGTAWL